MGCQEVMHNLLQMESALHNLNFANVDTEDKSVKLDAKGRRNTLLQAYRFRLESSRLNPNVRGKSSNPELSHMFYAAFAAKFYVPRNELINSIWAGVNRVVTFKPWVSSNPDKGRRYPDY